MVLLSVLTGASLFVALYMILAYAPIHPTLGPAQKIVYFAVPNRYAMCAGFVMCAIASGSFLVTRRARWDALARASGEAGLCFWVPAMLANILWAHTFWGTVWVMSSDAILSLVSGPSVIVYITVHRLARSRPMASVFPSVFALIAFSSVPVLDVCLRESACGLGVWETVNLCC